MCLPTTAVTVLVAPASIAVLSPLTVSRVMHPHEPRILSLSAPLQELLVAAGLAAGPRVAHLRHLELAVLPLL